LTLHSPPIRRAILSVSDKTGLAEFARALAASGVELYSTGGTRRSLEEAGLKVLDVSAYTGFPEMMDGRLKTLHPKVHGGILCRHDRPGDLAALREHGILSFELVVVNLYPFEATVAKAGATFEEAIEQIDIGGPTLVRAAAKNHAFTTIVTQPSQYEGVLQQLRSGGGTTPELRRELAAAAFALTARYDAAISAWWQGQLTSETFPSAISLQLKRKEVLRYGENPHQQAAVYALASAAGEGLIGARQLNGKELSYNNLLDLHSGLAIVRGLSGPAVAVIKHNNPCGAATHAELAVATRKAMDGDPVSAFGSVLGFNRPVDAASAEVLAEPGRFVEAIVAPGFEPDALKILTTRPKWKENVRLMELSSRHTPSAAAGPAAWEFRAVDGGFLVQEPDLAADPESEWKVVTGIEPSPSLWDELRFAWAIVRHVKSNAIVLCAEQSLAGVGAGQMSRVDSVEIAIQKAGPRAAGAVLASDAFFPFADSILRAAAAGVSAIIQPGGSRRDDEVIAACNEHRIPMLFTGRRHFKH
jgi:phosphoribosylaminoimidazolecarboxamide formyltransferase/IMP cyclohydrolase